MAHAPVADIFAGKYSVGDQVTVKGWVRTRRDSKAGLSFIALHDGSCFDPIQVIALSTMKITQISKNSLLVVHLW